jgi:hypothetical protein
MVDLVKWLEPPIVVSEFEECDDPEPTEPSARLTTTKYA